MSQERELKEQLSPVRKVGGQQETPTQNSGASLFFLPRSASRSPPQAIPPEIKRTPSPSAAHAFFGEKKSALSPAIISRRLDNLSTNTHLDIQQINDELLNLLTEKKAFLEVAEWFVKNQYRPEVIALRKKLDSELPENKEAWYALMRDPALYDGYIPLEPHVLKKGTTLKGFKEVHPFELMLGEYCRWRTRDQLYYVCFYLEASLKSARARDPEMLVDDLSDLYSVSKQESELRDPLMMLEQWLSMPGEESEEVKAAADIPFDRIEILLAEKKIEYAARYQLYVSCGMPSNMCLFEYLLEEAVIDLKKHHPSGKPARRWEGSEQVLRDRFTSLAEWRSASVHSLFKWVERECKERPSSVTYFYYALACKALALYFIALEGRTKQDSYWENFYLKKALYGIKVSARLFEHDAHLVHNAFLGKGFGESVFLRHLGANLTTPAQFEEAFLTQLPVERKKEVLESASQEARQFMRDNVETGQEVLGAGLSG